MKDSESRSHFRSIRISLRARFALGIALPILLVMSLLSVIHYWRERQLLEDQIRLSSLQLGEVLAGSLRHAMLANDPEMLAETLADVSKMENILEVQIIDLSGQVRADSRNEEVGQIKHLNELGCEECHQYPPETRPRTSKLVVSADTLRISTPIVNEPECAGCHSQENTHLGVLLADVSLVDIEKHLAVDLQAELLISAVTMILVMVGMYLLLHRLVVRRMVALRDPLAKLAAGDFSTRLPVSPGPGDVLDRHTRILNEMAEKLEYHTREQEERSKLRQRAIIEERERIARELHDGLAQLLGYVNTKAMAVRLMLKNRRIEAAEQHLLQLEEAARGLFVEVREAILGLKMAGEDGAGLTAMLKDFTVQFTRLSGLPVELTFAPAVESLTLTAETELQLLRIVQESLTNVRKHASATNVQIRMQIDNGAMALTVSDNGQGFDPDHVRADHRPHFGLSTMRERAEAIGAAFSLDSRPGAGTHISVRLPLEELSRAELKED